MVKKLQVFVSSTFEDLKDERQKAVEGILRAGHIPAGMELFTAGSRRQWDVIEDWIKESDILMLILGGKYGSIEPTTGISYTEMEYRYAIENNIPVFAIVLNDQFLADKKSKNLALKVYEAETEQKEIVKYEEFKKLATSNLVVFISNIEQIKTEVTLSLQSFMKDDASLYNFRGWVRPSDVLPDSSKEEVVTKVASNSNRLFEKDEQLLENVINRLENEDFVGTIEYISTYCSYVDDMKRKIDEFIWFGEVPSTRFFNDKVQASFDSLLKSLTEFSHFLSIHFFTRSHTDGMYLYPDLNIDFSYADDEQRKRYDQYVDRLFNTAKKATEEIKKFIFDSQKSLYS